ncbi:MAG: hypothetical protein ACOYO0_02675 [Sandarakinorhabdus sp.]|jgi:hypothetical protein
MAEPQSPEGAAPSVVVARMRKIGWSRVIMSLMIGSLAAWLAWQMPATMPRIGQVLRFLFGITAALQFAAAATIWWRLRQRPGADS